MKRIRAIIATLLISLPLGLAITVPLWAGSAPSYAVDTPAATACRGTGGTFTAGSNGASGTCASSAGGPSLTGGFKLVANTLIFVVGAISVIMVIIGGLRYVLSGGDSAGVKSAKDTILYALVGVVVAILAYAIVNFVITRIG